jgi:hypothetical protein
LLDHRIVDLSAASQRQTEQVVPITRILTLSDGNLQGIDREFVASLLEGLHPCGPGVPGPAGLLDRVDFRNIRHRFPGQGCKLHRICVGGVEGQHIGGNIFGHHRFPAQVREKNHGVGCNAHQGDG